MLDRMGSPLGFRVPIPMSLRTSMPLSRLFQYPRKLTARAITSRIALRKWILQCRDSSLGPKERSETLSGPGAAGCPATVGEN
jgi:hypothetical protein